jgi:DNA-binding NarL/FixJ family response regulator
LLAFFILHPSAFSLPDKVVVVVEYRRKVLVVDDVMATREGVVAILNRVPGIEVARVCETADEAREEIKKRHFDLVMCDLQLGEDNGIVLGRELLKINPDLKIVIYTKETSVVIAAEVFRHEYNKPRARRALTAVVAAANSNNNAGNVSTLTPVSTGLHGYLLLKNITPLSFERNLDTLNRQGNVVDPEILDLLLERLKRQSLTPRETECSELISRGKSNKEIAQQLGISQQAVENLINSLYNKLSINGEPKDPGRRVLLARTMERWRGLTREE